MLAHALDIRLFGAVRVWGRGRIDSSIDSTTPVIDCIGLPDDRDIRHALIVEDVVTTGKSVAAVVDVVLCHWPTLESVTIAGLFVRSAAIEPPDPRVRLLSGEPIEDDRWLIFPWERHESA